MTTATERDLSHGAQKLLADIKALSMAKGYCWASQQTLAKRLGRSIRTLRYHLLRLVQGGFLSIERDETYRTNRYRPIAADDGAAGDRQDVAASPARYCRPTGNMLPPHRQDVAASPATSCLQDNTSELIQGEMQQQQFMPAKETPAAAAAMAAPPKKSEPRPLGSGQGASRVHGRLPNGRGSDEKQIPQEAKDALEAFKALGVDCNAIKGQVCRDPNLACVAAAWMKRRQAIPKEKPLRPTPTAISIFQKPDGEDGWGFTRDDDGTWLAPDREDNARAQARTKRLEEEARQKAAEAALGVAKRKSDEDRWGRLRLIWDALPAAKRESIRTDIRKKKPLFSCGDDESYVMMSSCLSYLEARGPS